MGTIQKSICLKVLENYHRILGIIYVCDKKFKIYEIASRVLNIIIFLREIIERQFGSFRSEVG